MILHERSSTNVVAQVVNFTCSIPGGKSRFQMGDGKRDLTSYGIDHQQAWQEDMAGSLNSGI